MHACSWLVLCVPIDPHNACHTMPARPPLAPSFEQIGQWQQETMTLLASVSASAKQKISEAVQIVKDLVEVNTDHM